MHTSGPAGIPGEIQSGISSIGYIHNTFLPFYLNHYWLEKYILQLKDRPKIK